jgi:hypothetical protein
MTTNTGFDVSLIVSLSLPTGSDAVSTHGYDPSLQLPWSRAVSPKLTAAGMLSLSAPTEGDRRTVTGEATFLVNGQLTDRWDGCRLARRCGLLNSLAECRAFPVTLVIDRRVAAVMLCLASKSGSAAALSNRVSGRSRVAIHQSSAPKRISRKTSAPHHGPPCFS